LRACVASVLQWALTSRMLSRSIYHGANEHLVTAADMRY
jgi:hypothetical protein